MEIQNPFLEPDVPEVIAWGANAVLHGTPNYDANNVDVIGRHASIADTLANIMHYCERMDIDFASVLAEAEELFDRSPSREE